MGSKSASRLVAAAATLPGEFEFISAIAADLGNHGPKRAYADWLKERGDPRASFVRELATLTGSLSRHSKPLDSEHFPKAWTNMLGLPLFESIVRFNLGEVKDVILRLARPIVTIETEQVRENAIPIGVSKFGGHPDLPDDADWPRCDYGPLGFLDQIAVQDLKNAQVSHCLPKVGLLSFFAYQDFEMGYQPGIVDSIPDDTQVLYTPASANLKRRKPPEDLNKEGNAILPACQLTLRETWDLPGLDDKVAPAYAADLKKLREDESGERLKSIRRRCHPLGHHLMGYPVHLSAAEDTSPGPEWMHLLCLYSDDNLGWSWCDGGHLAVYVHEDDLRSGQFRRIYGYAA
ncbi:MAG: DUF1963 domain-containing protein [Gemmataceae bacterium]|nr:DUF1963 domain-containing protein [Gemmataceae bacterium]